MMSAQQQYIIVTLKHHVSTQKGALLALVTQGTLVMESAVTVNSNVGAIFVGILFFCFNLFLFIDFF